jgi:hypothetical protein
MSRGSEHVGNFSDGFVGAVVGYFKPAVWTVFKVWHGLADAQHIVLLKYEKALSFLDFCQSKTNLGQRIGFCLIDPALKSAVIRFAPF